MRSEGLPENSVAFVPTEDQVLAYFDQLSNWGRWGADDELGTLNLISPANVRSAAAEVRAGISVGCARRIITEGPLTDVTIPPLHFMLNSGESHDNTRANDYFGIFPHGLTITHVDALAHQFWQGHIYNNRPRTTVTTSAGARFCSVDAMRNGIITRGVLLDMPSLTGRRYLDAGEPILPEHLDQAEKQQQVELRPGDALLIRTGWSLRRSELGPHPTPRERPGLHAATLPWLYRREVAVVASDASHDVFPSGYDRVEVPVHSIGIVAMGLCLIDACQFEDLIAACSSMGRWSFLFVVAPVRFAHGTASPVTPIAVF